MQSSSERKMTAMQAGQPVKAMQAGQPVKAMKAKQPMKAEKTMKTMKAKQPMKPVKAKNTMKTARRMKTMKKMRTMRAMKTMRCQYSILDCAQIAIEYWEGIGIDGMFEIMEELYTIRALARRRVWRGRLSAHDKTSVLNLQSAACDAIAP